MTSTSKSIPTYKIRDYLNTSIFTLSLDGPILSKELSAKKEFDVSLPHMSDYCVFYLIKEGKFSIWVDFEEVVVTGPALFFMLPRQVKFLIFDGGLKGWSLTVDPIYVDRDLYTVLENEVFYPIPINASPEITGKLNSLIEMLHTIRLAKPEESSIQRHLANSCIGLFAHAYLQHNTGRNLPDNRQFQITKQFYELLRKRPQIQKSPSYYAGELNISLNYLNSCVKTMTDNPVSHWIHFEIIQQAKRALYYSESTIKEIAHGLGFDDTAYFTRLFTKIIGKSPRQFRTEFSKDLTVADKPEEYHTSSV